MKVVVVSSSPRRNGNSEVLADQFIKGAMEAGHEAEKVVLSQYKLNPCIACEYCRKHDHQCFQKDDADMIIKKIVDCDVFVFATPIYFYSLSAQLKILIDRFFAREYEIRDSDQRKKAYLILTSGTPDIKQTVGTVESFRGFIKVLRTVDEGGIVYGLGAFNRGDAYKHQAYQQAYEMGLNIS
ncbi:MAG: flavodoxin family protein [Erysipelotrichaceae bacterium]|nr:flavodoxin family protein [Erysipelotrichaceae bacterium]